MADMEGTDDQRSVSAVEDHSPSPSPAAVSNSPTVQEATGTGDIGNVGAVRSPRYPDRDVLSIEHGAPARAASGDENGGADSSSTNNAENRSPSLQIAMHRVWSGCRRASQNARLENMEAESRNVLDNNDRVPWVIPAHFPNTCYTEKFGYVCGILGGLLLFIGCIGGVVVLKVDATNMNGTFAVVALIVLGALVTLFLAFLQCHGRCWISRREFYNHHQLLLALHTRRESASTVMANVAMSRVPPSYHSCVEPVMEPEEILGKPPSYRKVVLGNASRTTADHLAVARMLQREQHRRIERDSQHLERQVQVDTDVRWMRRTRSRQDTSVDNNPETEDYSDVVLSNLAAQNEEHLPPMAPQSPSEEESSAAAVLQAVSDLVQHLDPEMPSHDNDVEEVEEVDEET